MKIFRRRMLQLTGSLPFWSAAVPALASQTHPSNAQNVVVKLFGAGLGSLDSYGTGVRSEEHTSELQSH